MMSPYVTVYVITNYYSIIVNYIPASSYPLGLLFKPRSRTVKSLKALQSP